MNTTEEQTLQIDSAITDKVAATLNECNLAKVFEECGLLEMANVKFQLIITPKKPLSIQNPDSLTGDQNVELKLLESSFLTGCYEFCVPCPDPSLPACWVPTDCTPLHTS